MQQKIIPFPFSYWTNMLARTAVILLFAFFARTDGAPSQALTTSESHEMCTDTHDFFCGDLRNPQCISSLWRCDNVIDCANGMDEFDCHYVTQCPAKFYMCLSTECIPAKNKCDGKNDCADGSDERDCHVAPPTAVPALTTSHSAPMPVPSFEFWCRMYFGCKHSCERTSTGPVCTCPENMILESDRKSCALVEVEGALDSSSGAYIWIIVLWLLICMFALCVLAVIVLLKLYPSVTARVDRMTPSFGNPLHSNPSSNSLSKE